MIVRAERAVDRLELIVDLPANVDVDDGTDAYAFRLGPGQERMIPLTFRCARWGVYPLGDVVVQRAIRSGSWSGNSTRQVDTASQAYRMIELPDPRARRDPGVRGQRGCPRQG